MMKRTSDFHLVQNSVGFRSANIMPAEIVKQIQEFITAIPTVKQHIHETYSIRPRLFEHLAGKLNLGFAAFYQTRNPSGTFLFPSVQINKTTLIPKTTLPIEESQTNDTASARLLNRCHVVSSTIK
jgi:hypothetical protein